MSKDKISAVQPIISILIAVRNESQHLSNTLNSLVDQDIPLPLIEVLILDGGSTDNTLEIAFSYADKIPGLRVLNNPGILSAAGWNLGLREARAPVVSILSGHVFLDRTHFRILLGALTIDRAGVGGKAVPIGYNKISQLIALAFSSTLGNGGASFMASDAPKAVETIAFGCYWREIVLKVGGFDEQIVRGQDWDLNLRLRLASHILWYVPEVQVRYSTRSDFRSLWRRQYGAGFWKPYIHLKNAAPFMSRHWLPSLFVLGTLFTTFGAFYSHTMRWALALGAFLYIGAAFVQGRKLGVRWKDLPAFFWSLWLIHTGYGTGMIIGALYSAFGVRSASAR